MKINAAQAGFFRYGNQVKQNEDVFGKNALKRGLLQNGTKQNPKQAAFGSSLLDDSLQYGSSLQASREKAKETSLRLKSLRYEFKSISTKILQSKTSAAAKQVANQARREVVRLKNKLQSGEYDDEEIQSAIVHAQAMERVAKKKAKHLLEEEMMKVTGGPCAGELEEKEEQDEIAGAQESPENEAMREQMEAYQDMLAAQMEQLQRAAEESMGTSVEDMMSEMMEEMADSMNDMLEEMGLGDLMESMTATPTEMDPADFKMMKLKHRSEEMKAIAKADAEYLKALFDRLEKMKGSSSIPGMQTSNSFGGMTSGGGGIAISGGAVGVPAVSFDAVSSWGDGYTSGDMGASGMPGGGGFDISI